MTDTEPAQPRAAASSLTLRGAAMMAAAFVLSRLGIDAASEQTQEILKAATDLIFSIGIFAVGIGRARAKGPIG